MGLTQPQREVVDWLRANRPEQGRVLCEDGVLGNMIPHYTGQETIGGLLGERAPLPHSHASVGYEKVFGRRQMKFFAVAARIARIPEVRSATFRPMR